jgi:hypothetical protein
MDDRLDEILRRLEALEQRVNELSRGENAASCPFRSEEKRIVDLIVRLTADRVEQGRDERSRDHDHHDRDRDRRGPRRER